MRVAMTVDEIRNQYPHPRRFEDEEDATSDYCVGGALCLASGIMPVSFPLRSTLAAVLWRVNPCLSRVEAGNFAYDIVHFNDDGDFERAWHTLREALEYTGQ